MADCLNNEQQIKSNLNSDSLTTNLDGTNNVSSEMGGENLLYSTMNLTDKTTSNLGAEEPIKSHLDLPTTNDYIGLETDNIVVTVDKERLTIEASLKQIKFRSFEDFPEIGSEKLIYIDANEKSLYAWDSTTASYYKLSSGSSSGDSYDDTEIRQSIADLETNKADKTEIPDVSNFITKAVNDLENYYTKSQTYTQAEVNALVSAIPKFKFEVVTSLPTENISTTTVYLVASGSETQNLYVEYIYVNDTWEKLGEQRIDLSNYYTKVQTEELVESAKLSFKKVASLPSSAEVEDNTIYLLQHTENGSVYYTEHIYKDGQWEQFGSNADVDIVGILDNTKKIALSTGGFSAGASSNVTGTGGAIGKYAQATRGGAIGESATTGLGFAGGYNAKTIKTLADGISTSPSDAIQLGTGTNQKEKSMQVYDDNIYDASTHTLTVKNIELDGEPLSNSSSFMPIGSIFASAIPQEDARVHLLDGSTISQTGVYADFANLIKSLVATGNNIAYETNDEFNEDVSTYGQCGKFVIDDTAGTIRLPIITEFVAGLTDLTNIGMAQLDMFKSHYHNIKTEGGNPPNGVVNPCASVFGGNQVTSNPNPIESTGGSETRPKNIRYPYYIVLASGYKSSSQVNIDNVMNEVNKLNQDYIVENTVTSTGGFRKWASGYKEYWGQTTTSSANHTITFPEEFSSINYGVSAIATTDNTASDIITAKVHKGTNNMIVRMRYKSTSGQGNATVNIAYFVAGY